MTNDLENLEKKLAEFQGPSTEKNKKSTEPSQESDNMNQGLQAGAELITPMAAGTFIGWGLDKWLGTSPLFLIIFLLTGIGVGFWNVYKITQNIGNSVGFAPLQKNEKHAKTSPDEIKQDNTQDNTE